jgi:hypothetical protein
MYDIPGRATALTGMRYTIQYWVMYDIPTSCPGKKKELQTLCLQLSNFYVGVAGFEPATLPPGRDALTGMRYTIQYWVMYDIPTSCPGKKKELQTLCLQLSNFYVGVAGFEPATLPPGRDALTGMRYTIQYWVMYDIPTSCPGKKKELQTLCLQLSNFYVGVAGFEPATLPPGRDALTGMRYTIQYWVMYDIPTSCPGKKKELQTLCLQLSNFYVGVAGFEPATLPPGRDALTGMRYTIQYWVMYDIPTSCPGKKKELQTLCLQLSNFYVGVAGFEPATLPPGRDALTGMRYTIQYWVMYDIPTSCPGKKKELQTLCLQLSNFYVGVAGFEPATLPPGRDALTGMRYTIQYWVMYDIPTSCPGKKKELQTLCLQLSNFYVGVAGFEPATLPPGRDALTGMRYTIQYWVMYDIPTSCPGKKKELQTLCLQLSNFYVGVAGFEPATLPPGREPALYPNIG